MVIVSKLAHHALVVGQDGLVIDLGRETWNFQRDVDGWRRNRIDQMDFPMDQFGDVVRLLEQLQVEGACSGSSLKLRATTMLPSAGHSCSLTKSTGS